MREKQFPDTDSVVSYVDTLERRLANPQIPISANNNPTVGFSGSGDLRVTSELFGCPVCKRQILKQQTAIKKGEEWNNIESLDRTLRVPVGVDARSYIG